MDRSYVTENAAERARLKALVARLSDAEMARPMSPQWTVGVGLAHVAFLDRLWLSKFEEWEQTGVVEMPAVRIFIHGINDAMLPWWENLAQTTEMSIRQITDALPGKVSRSVVGHIVQRIRKQSRTVSL